MKRNEKDSGHSSKMTSSCEWPINTQSNDHVEIK